MPEEINRIVTDQLSHMLFCPTSSAVENLHKEGFDSKPIRVVQTGDVMQDAALLFSEKASAPIATESIPDNFILATLHRAENTDEPQRLASIISALNRIHQNEMPVVLPLHPRTKKLIKQQGLSLQVTTIDPVGYIEMLWLLDHCQLVLTDSGGVQKEAFFFSKACVTMREQTEWVELVEAGANEVVGADEEDIVQAARKNIGRRVQDSEQLYGGGEASQRILDELCRTQH
jgi:UDP-GlcNAc3NAcA epimerase